MQPSHKGAGAPPGAPTARKHPQSHSALATSMVHVGRESMSHMNRGAVLRHSQVKRLQLLANSLLLGMRIALLRA